MGKIDFKPGNMLYPLPVVLVSCSDGKGQDNIITIAWAGNVCTNPPRVSISVRHDRHSYQMIKESGEFVINLTTKDLAYATDYCGVVSGRKVDKWEECQLTKLPSKVVNAPCIKESPVNIECKVVKQIDETELPGSHDIFIAEVVAVHCDEEYMDENKCFRLEEANPLMYIHGNYYATGECVGKFGHSIQRKLDK